MGHDKFELFVKDKLEDYQSPINTEALWAGIHGTEATVVTAASSSIIMWKWFAGIVLVGTLVAGGYWLGSITIDEENPITDKNITNESSIVSSQLKDDNFDNLRSESIEKQSKQAENKQVNTQASDRNTIDNTGYQLSTSTYSLDGDGTRGSEANVAKTASKNNNQSSKHQEIAISVNTGSQAKTTYDVSRRTSDDIKVAQIDKQNTDMNSKKSGVAGIQNSFDQTINTTQVQDGLLSMSDNYLVSSSGILGADLLSKKMSLPNPIACPDFGDKNGLGGRLGLELQLIPYYSNPLFNALDDDGEEWKQTRLATESYLESFQINLLARYQHNSGIYVHAGIGYGQIDEKLELMTSDITEIELDTITTLIFFPDGTIDTTFETIEVESENTVEARTYNYHRMIELPFALGYEFGIRERMGLFFDIGGSLNLAVYRTGYVVVDRNDLVPFDSTSRPVFRTSTGFKIKSALGIRFYTNSDWTISVGPEIRYHTGNWLRPELNLEQRYLDIGLRIAAGYNF